MNNDYNFNNNGNFDNNGNFNNNPNYGAPVETVNAYPAETVSASSCMTLGIVATALSELGLPGIIVGAIGRKKANIFASEHGGQVFGKAKVGRILSNVGFGLGIGMTVFWVIYIIVMAAAGAAVAYGAAGGFDEFMAVASQYITL